MTLPILKWAPSPNFSARTARVDLIVIHDTEGAYAGAVAWFEQVVSQVSAHYVVKEDGTEATQMVDLAKKAWHACLFNSRSVGIEMAGKESVGIDDRCWAATAAMTAYLLHHLQIPCKFAEGGTGPGFCAISTSVRRAAATMIRRPIRLCGRSSSPWSRRNMPRLTSRRCGRSEVW